MYINLHRLTALEQGQVPIIVEEPTTSGARRFFKGGRCDTAGPKLSKSEANSTTDATSSGSSSDTRTHTHTAMSEAPSDSDDRPLKVQKGTARTSSKEKEASSDYDDEDEDDDAAPVKKKGKGTKAASGKTRKAGLSAEVPVKKGRAKREETHVVQEPVEARKKEPKPEPVVKQKPVPRPLKKAKAGLVAAEDNTLVAGGRGPSEAASPGPIDTDIATRKPATTVPTLTTRTSTPDRSISAANVVAPCRNAPRGLTPLNTNQAPAPVDARAAPLNTNQAPAPVGAAPRRNTPRGLTPLITNQAPAPVDARAAPLNTNQAPAPVDARAAPTRGLLPPDATCRPCVDTPAVVPVPSHGPMPLDASADTAAVILAPAHETRRSDTRPTVNQPHSPPKRSAEEEVDSVHKRLRNNSGTATVRPTREDTPIHPPEDLDGPGHYPSSVWDGPYAYNYGPPRRFGGSYYHPSYAPPPNWGWPPGYPNYPEHMSYTEHPHHHQDPHHQDADDGYGPYPMNAYHQGGPLHFFPPQHYPTDPRRGHMPSEHSSKHSHHKDNQDDA